MDKQFSDVLHGKKIPVLTLDNKWYKLLDQETREQLSESEDALNQLLKRQGKLNTDLKSIKKLKHKLMNEIVELADGQDSADNVNIKKIEQNKAMVEECNQRIADYQDELLELPREIDKLNSRLMLATIEICYEKMHENLAEIDDITTWVNEIRVELKKKLVKKQEMEKRNQLIYSYMHDIFGAEVVNIFDMKYQNDDK